MRGRWPCASPRSRPTWAPAVPCTPIPDRTRSVVPPDGTPPCSVRPAISTSTSRTACTTAPTSSADRKTLPQPSCSGRGKWWRGSSWPWSGGRRRNQLLDLASGPARLATALALTTADSGRDALSEPFRLQLPAEPAAVFSSGPRVGVSGDGGTEAYPWRFWLPGEPTVSRYKPAKPRPATFQSR